MPFAGGVVARAVHRPPLTASDGLDSAAMPTFDAESQRLQEDAARTRNWKRWGPYLSERQWGTVREDYSPDGTCWGSFSHDHARSRAYRWGEDGILGFSDRECRLCFALAMWNGRDPILKERLFGLTGPEGNHGEDVKECYYYLDATPTASWTRALYKYPQAEFPYAHLVEENRRRDRSQGEFELADTGLFDESRYFDVVAEYAKAGHDDICVAITVHNRGPDAHELHLLPTFWFRNTWSWGCRHEGCEVKPNIRLDDKDGTLITHHASLNPFRLAADGGPDGVRPTWLFTDNESNVEKLWGVADGNPYSKDAFHRYVIDGETTAVNPRPRGTKVAAYYRLNVPAGGSVTVHLRWSANDSRPAEPFGAGFAKVFAQRQAEADSFYGRVLTGSADERAVARQAYAGLVWSKQFYHYVVEDWMRGDPDQPPPPEGRENGRNKDWSHLYSRDVMSMPDKWEYPWFAAWDLAFHMIPFARIDPDFAKQQLLLLLREWYMHPNGQIPAYEFAFGDVNPPVHAWAAWQVYRMGIDAGDKPDVDFLERVFQKLLLNFTWWVNRKDVAGKHLFSGGFLGLDNIGVFDRSKPLPGGGSLEQADGTAWMAFYAGRMMTIALELATFNPVYEDIASKFFEHFIAIVDAMNGLGGTGLWDKTDGFYYDQLSIEGQAQHLRIRSMVGIIPLFAVEVLSAEIFERFPGFAKRTLWFLKHRQDLAQHIAYLDVGDDGAAKANRLLAIPSRERLEQVLKYLLDEREFLSAYGVRSLSRIHHERPFILEGFGSDYRVDYDPNESTSGVFGGNSNWRGPVWFPVNFLLIEALRSYHRFYGDSLKVELPTGSGNLVTLDRAADEIATRLARLFLPGRDGQRPCHGNELRYRDDPHWKDLLLFHEYFHGDNGRGLGANHQTGWTALVVECLGKADGGGAPPVKPTKTANTAAPASAQRATAKPGAKASKGGKTGKGGKKPVQVTTSRARGGKSKKR